MHKLKKTLLDIFEGEISLGISIIKTNDIIFVYST